MNPSSHQQPPIALNTKEQLFLSYDYAKATHRIPMTWETDAFRKALGKAKEQKPRVDAFKGTLKGIFMDFDDLNAVGQALPPAYSTTWDAVENWMNQALGTNGCVFRSASGKVKVFCPIRTGSIDQAQAKAFVKRSFSSYFHALDSKGGFRYSFIDASSYDRLKKYLKSNEYELAVEKNTDQWNEGIRNKKEVGILYDKDRSKPFSWNLFAGQVPSSVLALPKNVTLVKVFRAAAGAFYLSTTHGVALPQHQLAELFEVSQPAISSAIARMIKLGIIRRTAYACQDVGLAAKYRFEGSYLEWAKAELNKIRANKLVTRSVHGIKVARSTIESQFKAGRMNHALFLYTRFFHDPESYLKACWGQPYFGTKPEHERQALSAWENHQKRQVKKYDLGFALRMAA